MCLLRTSKSVTQSKLPVGKNETKWLQVYHWCIVDLNPIVKLVWNDEIFSRHQPRVRVGNQQSLRFSNIWNTWMECFSSLQFVPHDTIFSDQTSVHRLHPFDRKFVPHQKLPHPMQKSKTIKLKQPKYYILYQRCVLKGSVIASSTSLDLCVAWMLFFHLVTNCTHRNWSKQTSIPLDTVYKAHSNVVAV